MCMPPFTIYSIWVGIWYQQKIIDISVCVPLRLGKRQWQCRIGLMRFLIDLRG